MLSQIICDQHSKNVKTNHMRSTLPHNKKRERRFICGQHQLIKKKNDLSQSDKSTNRGLISEDRSTEATLLFTIPRSCLSRLHRIYL